MIIPINQYKIKPKLQQKIDKKEVGISFYTTCMNRTEHLRQTLPYNLDNLKNVKKVEFVILNYNSKDDLDSFMSGFRNHFKTGRIKYYKETFSKFFHTSHAFNMAAKLCEYEIICHTNADYFVDLDWYNFIINNLKENTFIYNEGGGSANSRSAFWRKDFLKLRGFDELMLGWGWEDIDLYNRASKMGLKGINIKDKKYFWNYIEHSSNIRQKDNNKRNRKIALSRTFKVNEKGFGQGRIIEKNLQKTQMAL